MASLAEIRAKLLASQYTNKNSNGGDNQLYKHWDIPEGATTTIRLLQDGNTANEYFWVEKATIKMPFAGVKGETNSKPVEVQVPCMETWGEPCPVLTEVVLGINPKTRRWKIWLVFIGKKDLIYFKDL